MYARQLTDEKMRILSRIPIEPFRLAFDSIKYKTIYSDALKIAAKSNLANYILDIKMREYFTDLFGDYNTNVNPLNWVVHRPDEYQLPAKDLIDLPRKGLLALINFLIA